MQVSCDKVGMAETDATCAAPPGSFQPMQQPVQQTQRQRWWWWSRDSPQQNHFDKWCAAHLQGFGQQKQLTILLSGQTGSGKSSFLNLLGNFPTVMQHGQEAVAGKMTDFRNLEFENDVKDQKVSQTSAATVYQVDMGPLSLKIVDTPGFGDTRGRSFEEKHTKMIVDCVKELGQVNAIAFVISGRDSRLTAQLKYVLMEVCAILPKEAKNNIVAIFTNTTSPLYLSFDIDALNGMVEHPVKPDRQIFIENPYVLWERSKQNKGKVDDAALQTELVKAFKDAGENLAKLFDAMLTMPTLNTAEFERLYKLRQAIESYTVQILTELEWAQEQQKKFQQLQRQVQLAQTEEDMNKHYTKRFHGKRWVFKDADRHGTFCGVKDCHCNCHAPCYLEKTMDQNMLRFCAAFNHGKQDTCRVCGHHRKYHFHDDKIWCEEEYDEEVVDEETKRKYEAAKDLKEKQKTLLEGIQDKIEQCGKRQKDLGATLVINIRRFEQHGLSRNYAMLLQNQRDLFQQHIDATLETDEDADISELKKTKEEVEKALHVVQEHLLISREAFVKETQTDRQLMARL